MEVYVPEQAVVANGTLNLIMDRAGTNISVPTPAGYTPNFGVGGGPDIPPPLYGWWNRPTTDAIAPNETAFKSGMVTSWNKFCYTGGYIEANITFPGTADAPAFWPAFWLLGVNARACYRDSTDGFWPYSYSTCGGEWWLNSSTGSSNTSNVHTSPQGHGSQARPQFVTACNDSSPTATASSTPTASDYNKTVWGLDYNTGRGAPEIDMVEFKVEWDAASQTFFPQSVITLQSAPPLPNGTTWTGGPGQIFPSKTNGGMVAGLTHWKGNYTAWTDSDTYRPGNEFQDSISGYVKYDKASFGSRPYTIGLHWEPGEFIRWYVDGHFVYEVNKDAVRAQSNAQGQTTGPRLVPEEPMQIILNLAMSDSFTHDFITNGFLAQTQFPASMKVDYVRVWQDANNPKHTVGCSPPDKPTEQYIACNTEKFIIRQEDQVLAPQPCLGDWSCRLDFNYEYIGADLDTVGRVPDVKACCKACQDYAGCGAYSFNPNTTTCFLKNETGWQRTSRPSMMSGVAIPPVCVLDPGTVYTGGGEVAALSVATPIECCRSCHTHSPECGAFSFIPSSNTSTSSDSGNTTANCFLKSASGWTKESPTVPGTVSGRLGPTSSLSRCNLKTGTLLQGGDMRDGQGNLITSPAASPVQCCNICTSVVGCAAYTFVPTNDSASAQQGTCYLKLASGWVQTQAPTATVSGRISTDGTDASLPDLPVDNRTCALSEQGIRLQGGDLVAEDGNLLISPASDPSLCCAICMGVTNCSAYTWSNSTCFLKASTGWRAIRVVDSNGTAAVGDISGAIAPLVIPSPPPTAKCSLSENMKLQGGDILLQNGDLFTSSASAPQECCDICATASKCAAFSYDLDRGVCYLKSDHGGAVAVDQGGWTSGKVVASSSSTVALCGGMMVWWLMAMVVVFCLVLN